MFTTRDLLALVCALATAPAQIWVDRTERPYTSSLLFAAGGPDGGPALVVGDRILQWHGAGWSLLALVPDQRIVLDMAFDRGRQRIVALMRQPPNFDYQTYELRPGSLNWQRAATPTPRPGLLCFDPALGRVLNLTSDPQLGTTQDYSWDGSSWTPLSANIRPFAGRTPVAADLQRGRLVAFTSSTTQLPGGQTLEWDGTAWSNRAPATAPPPRDGGTMAWDPIRGRVTLFGDYDMTLRDTWQWDGVSWQQVATPFPPNSHRGARLAFDRVRGALLLLDPGTPSTVDYEFTGTGWQRLRLEPPFASCQLGTDPLRRRVVRHHGGIGTFEWDGSSWGLVVIGGPTARAAPMAFDRSLPGVVVFGGGFSLRNDTWTWDGAQWTRQLPPTSPPARRFHALVARPLGTPGVILFGGDAGAPLRDTWLWSQGRWTDLTGTLPVAPPGGQCSGASGPFPSDPLVLTNGEVWRFSGSWSLVDDRLPVDLPRLAVTAAGRPLVMGIANNELTSHELVGGSWLRRGDLPRWVEQFAYEPVHGDLLGTDCAGTYLFTATPGGVRHLGAGCGAPAPELFVAGPPRLGNSRFRFAAVADPSSPTLFAADLAGATTPLGGGCTSFLAQPTAIGLAFANAYGGASLAAPVPGDSALVGLAVFVQVASVQPGGPVQGLALSRGLEVTIGH